MKCFKCQNKLYTVLDVGNGVQVSTKRVYLCNITLRCDCGFFTEPVKVEFEEDDSMRMYSALTDGVNHRHIQMMEAIEEYYKQLEILFTSHEDLTLLMNAEQPVLKFLSNKKLTDGLKVTPHKYSVKARQLLHGKDIAA